MQVKLLWAPAWEPSGMAKLAMLVVYLSLHLFVNLLHYFGIHPSVLSLTASLAMSTLCQAQKKTPTRKMGSCVIVDMELIWLTLLRTPQDNHTGTQDRVVLHQSSSMSAHHDINVWVQDAVSTASSTRSLPCQQARP